jgi:hypothetical protein
VARITQDGAVITAPKLNLAPKTDGRRRTSDFLAAFLDLTAKLESPLGYLQWSGLATVAGASQRKIYMESTAFFAFTNMYIVLVGPPGSKKSTAIRAGRKLLKKIPTINMSGDAPSVVGLMKDFADIPQKDHQSLNAFISEFSSLFENATETMTGFLTAIYDGDPDYTKRTRVGGKEHIPFPWLNMIAGTTPTWLGDNLQKSAVEGGLVARTLYIFSDEIILQSPFPRYNAKLRQLEEYLIHDLAHIANLQGEFEFEGGEGDTDGSGGGEAWRWYFEWYMDRARFPRVSDNRTAGYYVRKPIHLLKVAMSISLSKGDSLRLSLEDLQIALAFLDRIEPGMSRAFSAVGGNVYATEIERVERILRQAGVDGLSYADLVAATYHNMEQRQLDATLTTLRTMGRIAGQNSLGYKVIL